MTGITFQVLMAGILTTIAGLILQTIGRVAFLRFKGDDTKELAGIVGLRVSAIFSIAVGFIFAAAVAHLLETKRDVLEETRLIATLNFLAGDSIEQERSGAVRSDLEQYARLSARELDDAQADENSANSASRLLLKICRQMAPDDRDSAEIRWTKSEFQRSCAKLIDIRGTKRIGAREKYVSSPFWIFFVISFGFLAMLFGVFDPRPINIVFASLFYFATGVAGMLIYAASDPYHNPGKVSSAPLMKLIERMGAAGGSGKAAP